MNNLKLIITDEAFNDVDRIADFIAQYNPRAARETVEFLFGACNNLLKFPNLGLTRERIKSKVKHFKLLSKNCVKYKFNRNI